MGKERIDKRSLKTIQAGVEDEDSLRLIKVEEEEETSLPE